MPRHTTLDRILQLDPQRDHQEIVSLTSSYYEFPFDVTRSLEFALFRTFAVPSVSALLDHTGEFQQRPQKRYDDTDLLLSALYEYGYDSERGRAALRRMNQQHGRCRSQMKITCTCSPRSSSRPRAGLSASAGGPWWSKKCWRCSTSGARSGGA